MNKIYLLIIVILFACRSSKDIQTETRQIDFTIVSSSQIYGAGEEGLNNSAQIVNSQAEYEKITQKMSSVNTIDLNFEPENNYFEDKTLIFIFDQVRGSAGYTFAVQRITQNKNKLVLQIDSARPEGMAATVMTQPFQVIEVAKFSGEVELRFIAP
jgi:hypothetical protein